LRGRGGGVENSGQLQEENAITIQEVLSGVLGLKGKKMTGFMIF